MKSVASALVLLAVTATSTVAAPVSVRWHGQSFFEIKSPAGVRIVIDPHAIENFGRPEPEVNADYILISHPHPDHSQVEIVANVKSAKIINAIKDEKGDGKNAEWVNVDLTDKDVKIKTVGTFHDSVGGMKRGKNGVFVLDVAGVKIVHLGDLGHKLTDDQVKRIGRVDVLLIPVGGVYTINGSDAKEVVDQLKPRRYIVPMHYGIKRVYDDLLSADEFLEDQEEGTVEKFKTNELLIDARTRAPAHAIIAILEYQAPMKK
jgi:L-ascorbate metabolism protein UlaG (beta-lactamase superfamily)